MHFFHLIWFSLLCFVFQPQYAHAAPEISPELIYGEWKAEGRIWKFYSTDLTRPEYKLITNQPDRPHKTHIEPEKADEYESRFKYDIGDKDPIGLRKARRNDAFVIAVGSRKEGKSFFDTSFYTGGRYVDNNIKTAATDDQWDLTELQPKYPMPEPSQLPAGDDMYKKVRTPVFCGKNPEYLGVSREERKQIKFPLIVNFPPDVPYHWVEFKVSVENKTKEVQMEAEVWSMKRICKYKYSRGLYNNENVSTFEPYISSRFKLIPIEPRYARNYPEYEKAEGAEKQAAF